MKATLKKKNKNQTETFVNVNIKLKKIGNLKFDERIRSRVHVKILNLPGGCKYKFSKFTIRVWLEYCRYGVKHY